jgi:hypothetical protein
VLITRESLSKGETSPNSAAHTIPSKADATAPLFNLPRQKGVTQSLRRLEKADISYLSKAEESEGMAGAERCMFSSKRYNDSLSCHHLEQAAEGRFAAKWTSVTLCDMGIFGSQIVLMGASLPLRTNHMAATSCEISPPSPSTVGRWPIGRLYINKLAKVKKAD